MRFCSAACLSAYQRRLHHATKQKIAQLWSAAADSHTPTGLR
jgi:hypothetical protein